ncbi:hypothetical protein ACI65C_013754 [Semiaphis heraclei]
MFKYGYRDGSIWSTVGRVITVLVVNAVSLSPLRLFTSCVIAISGNDERVRPLVTAPTYNELFALVTQLHDQVESLSARAVTPQAEQNASLNLTSVTKSEVAEFRVVPDLNKTISQFTGRESSHEAENWLDDINGIASANGWPIGYRLQFVRANIQGAARNWFVGKTFGDWPSFDSKFRSTFIRSLNTSDRYDLLKAQEKTNMSWITSNRK